MREADVHLTCEHHPDREALAQCEVCGDLLCAECVLERDGQTVCRQCVDHAEPLVMSALSRVSVAIPLAMTLGLGAVLLMEEATGRLLLRVGPLKVLCAAALVLAAGLVLSGFGARRSRGRAWAAAAAALGANLSATGMVILIAMSALGASDRQLTATMALVFGVVSPAALFFALLAFIRREERLPWRFLLPALCGGQVTIALAVCYGWNW